jgi:hypothetical protein
MTVPRYLRNGELLGVNSSFRHHLHQACFQAQKRRLARTLWLLPRMQKRSVQYSWLSILDDLMRIRFDHVLIIFNFIYKQNNDNYE